MSSVVCYLPYFRQWLITHLLSAFLPFLHLFTDSLGGDHLLVAPLFPGALLAIQPPLLYASFLFNLHCSDFLVFFVGQGVSLPRGLCWLIPGVAGGILHDTWHLPVWSAECLPCRFGAGSSGGIGGSSGSPPVFSE
jgi:hypothetical protein